MPKLVWVALPLLLAAAWLAAQALLRRPPSRHAVNVWSSVLLLAYVLTTAGLGIFWVANQQLPVFDWHFLFGYGTVLLVALHLVFNFPVAWRYFTRPRHAAPPRDADAAPGRRGALGLIGVVLATGVAFALGMRHGRSELRLDMRPSAKGETAPDPAATALALVERFHAFSSHSRAGVFLRAPGVNWGDPPASFKRYPGVLRVALPAPNSEPGRSFDLAALGAVLWHTTGVTEVRAGLRLRASPSSGALFSSELYVAARSVRGLEPGLWHYDPEAHALERLGGTPPHDAALGAPGEPALQDAAAVVVATAVFRRTGHKYRDRTYRYVLADLGHALENLRVASGAVGAEARFIAAFDESRTAATLGLDEAEEGVLAVVAMHLESDAGRARWPPALAASNWLPAMPGSAESAPLGVTAAVHAATSLRVAVARSSTAGTAVAPPAPLSPGSIVLPSVTTAPTNRLQVIATRRSVRRFASTLLPLDALAGVLAQVSAQSSPILSAAIRIHLVVHGVDGIRPGAYRFEPELRALLPSRVPADLRHAARAAALDQDVIGDAAVVFVLSMDRATFAADPLGPARGYRHAFLEAGLVGERLYLEAGARRLGVCAVGAFYDDEAAALVAVDPASEWVVHFAGLGVPSS